MVWLLEGKMESRELLFIYFCQSATIIGQDFVLFQKVYLLPRASFPRSPFPRARCPRSAPRVPFSARASFRMDDAIRVRRSGCHDTIGRGGLCHPHGDIMFSIRVLY